MLYLIFEKVRIFMLKREMLSWKPLGLYFGYSAFYSLKLYKQIIECSKCMFASSEAYFKFILKPRGITYTMLVNRSCFLK